MSPRSTRVPSLPEVADAGTRDRLLQAALAAFSSMGYEGVSVRDIERQADVNRGLVAYHFGGKDELWKAMMDSVMGQFKQELTPLATTLMAVSPNERPRVAIKVIVRLIAGHLDLFRLLVLLAGDRSERTVWFMDTHVRPIMDFFRQESGRVEAPQGDQHLVFLAVAASATVCSVISMPFFFEALLDADLSTEAGTEHFIEAVSEFFIGNIGGTRVAFSSGLR